MSDNTEKCYVTVRAARPFLYRGQTIEAGDIVTLPAAEAQRLRARSKRYVEHVLDANLSRLYATSRRAMELHFE